MRMPRSELTRLQSGWAGLVSKCGGSMAVHTPVLLAEVLHELRPEPGRQYIDATADGGGHTVALIRAVEPDGKVLALEWDEALFQELTVRLARECSHSNKNYILKRTSYTEIAHCVRSLRFSPVAGVLFDLGMSSFHLAVSRRGFSFQKNEALDMRYSQDLRETAADILQRCTPHELEAILKDFGEERFARSIAREIVARRRQHPIRTTADLVAMIRNATPVHYHRGRIHFATRTFQALRIAVNHELENLEKGLGGAAAVLAPGGRIAVISFHSLEDRIVKKFFRREDVRNHFAPVLKKPLIPSRSEIATNPRARSARLRVFEKII